MNVDYILKTMNRHQTAYILIGGMNFLMRHEPMLTYDVDLWIENTDINLERCEQALAELQAEWGPTDKEWKPATSWQPGWLKTQWVFCMSSPHGAIDIFRAVTGLKDWQTAYKKALLEKTKSGVTYRGLSDEDMLQCQLALDVKEQKKDRIKILEKAVKK